MASNIIDPRLALESRHLEFIALCSSGYTNEEIAKKKFVAVVTVQKILQQARQRVGAKNSTHLCMLCLLNNVITFDGNDFVPIQDERVVA